MIFSFAEIAFTLV